MINKIIKFFQEVKVEISKVSWPTRQELYNSTIIVIVSTALTAIFVGSIGIIFSKIIKVLLQ
ncbi:MAG: preprotein translocase subunit SecE [Candidatus Gygaella obscura]|nr:preprotein translocase subunit SecE [Candidatus Gygaella obscura]